jgi:hypothetical protein
MTLRNLEDVKDEGKSESPHAIFDAHDIDTQLHEVETGNKEMNPHFLNLAHDVNMYLGAATAHFHGIQGTVHPAIRDENRNAIIPGIKTEIGGRVYYFSIKGCGAYSDMFSTEPLTRDTLVTTCHDPSFIPRLQRLPEPSGFIMAESWMGESPYGAQGESNARDALEFSILARDASINGAYICPVAGIVPLAGAIEEAARNFYWFRPYPHAFYQEVRLVPSRTRIYFESPELLANPESALGRFHVDTPKQVERFEINFIKSGLALLSLFTRSARESGNAFQGIVYHDVWLDKDAVVAPDGTIHFADLEGLEWRRIPRSEIKEFQAVQHAEWDKLVYEFLYALVQIDAHRAQLEGMSQNWARQRESLALYIQLAIEKDPFLYIKLEKGNMNVMVENPAIPATGVVEIPLLHGTKSF